MPPRIIQFTVGLLIFFSLANPASGQKTGTGGEIISPKPKPKAEEPRQTTGARLKIITRYVEKPVTPRTGRLFVAAEPGAVILIEPLNIRGAEAQKGTVPEGQRAFIFNDLNPGNYRVAATLAGFHEVQKSPIVIKRNESETVTLDFQPILYSVVVQTNVDGELKYGLEGEVPKSVPLQNKRATLQLPAGTYAADVEPAESVYKPEHKQFTVTGDTTVAFNLKRMEFSKETLRSDWTPTELKNWEIPSTWQAGPNKILMVKGAGVGLPRDESKRYYKDFQLISDIKLTNGVSASFVLRAQDARNYYLMEFTGGQADEPFYVRLFVVKNGIEKRIQAIQIPNAAAATLKNGQAFTSITIKATDNKFSPEIVDNESANSYPLGILIDPDRTFSAGGVGVAARGNAESVVWRFIVCTECPRD
jgi:hypothetical protein